MSNSHKNWLSEPIWEARLQAIWIFFTACYISIGNVYSSRWISSLIITIAGMLLLLLVCHSVASKDKSRNKNTLLVAVAACLFISFESYKTYKDFAGSIFAAIFALSISLIVWIKDDDPKIVRVIYAVILMLVSMLIFSLIQLLSTVSIKQLWFINYVETTGVYVAPHVVGIVVGMCVSLILDKRIIEKTIQVEVIRYDFKYRLLRLLIFPLLGFYLVYLFNYNSVSSALKDELDTILLISLHFFIQLIFVMVVFRCVLLNNVNFIKITILLLSTFCFSVIFSLFENIILHQALDSVMFFF